MTRLQAFILVFFILLLQTGVLIVFGHLFGKYYAAPTAMLFVTVDLVLAGCADALNVVKENEYE